MNIENRVILVFKSLLYVYLSTVEINSIIFLLGELNLTVLQVQLEDGIPLRDGELSHVIVDCHFGVLLEADSLLRQLVALLVFFVKSSELLSLQNTQVFHFHPDFVSGGLKHKYFTSGVFDIQLFVKFFCHSLFNLAFFLNVLTNVDCHEFDALVLLVMVQK